jgi:undecaprenyl pyrophosphate phosphatase UppP
MNTLQAIIIAIIEGLTEFYPFHLPLGFVALMGMKVIF